MHIFKFTLGKFVCYSFTSSAKTFYTRYQFQILEYLPWYLFLFLFYYRIIKFFPLYLFLKDGKIFINNQGISVLCFIAHLNHAFVSHLKYARKKTFDAVLSTIVNFKIRLKKKTAIFFIWPALFVKDFRVTLLVNCRKLNIFEKCRQLFMNGIKN